jgi:hypothetical protein
MRLEKFAIPFANAAGKIGFLRWEVRLMLIRVISIVFVVAIAFSAAAQADFVIISPRPAAPPSTRTTAPAHHPALPHFKIAAGFGDRIPLSFAVRQIVPSDVRVTYGSGADPNAHVNWKGGEGWNRVLLAAVKPLGLRLVMTSLAVEIRE